MKSFFVQKKYHYELFLKQLCFTEQLRVLGKKYLHTNKRFRSLEIGLTYRCQLRCKHCGIAGQRDDTRSELSQAEWKNIIDVFHKKNKGFFIVFAGAEPLLREDIFDLIQYSKRKGIIVGVSTNGLMLDEKTVKKLKRSGTAFLNISLDGPCAATHDANRNEEGVFNRVVESFHLCHAYDLPAIVSTFVTKSTIAAGQPVALIEKAREIGAAGVRILFAVPSGELIGCPSASFTETEKGYIRGLLDPLFVYVEGICNVFMECNALLKKLFFISPYGDVQPCSFVPKSFGNIKDEPLVSIMQRMETDPLFTLSADDCIMRNPAFYSLESRI
jgi:AdoMet-dependent heme synthase